MRGDGVGENVGQPVPNELPRVIDQPERGLERACTSVGTSDPQKLLLFTSSPRGCPPCSVALSNTSLPSSVGKALVKLVNPKCMTEVIWASCPS